MRIEGLGQFLSLIFVLLSLILASAPDADLVQGLPTTRFAPINIPLSPTDVVPASDIIMGKFNFNMVCQAYRNTSADISALSNRYTQCQTFENAAHEMRRGNAWTFQVWVETGTHHLCAMSPRHMMTPYVPHLLWLYPLLPEKQQVSASGDFEPGVPGCTPVYTGFPKPTYGSYQNVNLTCDTDLVTQARCVDRSSSTCQFTKGVKEGCMTIPSDDTLMAEFFMECAEASKSTFILILVLAVLIAAKLGLGLGIGMRHDPATDIGKKGFNLM